MLYSLTIGVTLPTKSSPFSALLSPMSNGPLKNHLLVPYLCEACEAKQGFWGTCNDPPMGGLEGETLQERKKPIAVSIILRCSGLANFKLTPSMVLRILLWTISFWCTVDTGSE